MATVQVSVPPPLGRTLFPKQTFRIPEMTLLFPGRGFFGREEHKFGKNDIVSNDFLNSI